VAADPLHLASERHAADAIVTRTRQLALSQYPIAAELACRTDRIVRRKIDIDATMYARIQPRNPPVNLFVGTLALRAHMPQRRHLKISYVNRFHASLYRR